MAVPATIIASDTALQEWDVERLMDSNAPITDDRGKACEHSQHDFKLGHVMYWPVSVITLLSRISMNLGNISLYVTLCELWKKQKVVA